MGKINRVGEKYITNEGYEIEIIQYFSANKCVVKFSNGYLVFAEYKQIKRGTVRNPYYPTVYGVGYIGVGKHKTSNNGKKLSTYLAWFNMLERGYSKKYKEDNPSYTDCLVDERWHNFQEFAEWFEVNCVKNFSLDKDILFKGNKIYSPETCCFVPREINSLFVKPSVKREELPLGVRRHHNKFQASFSKANKRSYLGLFNTSEEAFQAYKVAKEQYIKEIADKYKNQITEVCYQALYNYKVEIND